MAEDDAAAIQDAANHIRNRYAGELMDGAHVILECRGKQVDYDQRAPEYYTVTVSDEWAEVPYPTEFDL